MSSSPDTNREKGVSKHPSPENPSKRHMLPTWHANGRLHTKYIHAEGESGRCGFHPYHFFRILWQSPASRVNRYLNFLWPFVPAAFALYFADREHHHPAQFATAFLGIIPAASLLDFAGGQFAKKLPRALGVVIETFFGGIVEIVLFMILIAKHQGTGVDPETGERQRNNIPVILAAILGSILTNLLLCLGGCFVAGGIKHKEQTFHKVISETGSGLLLVAGFALLIPSAFYSALSGAVTTAENGEGYTLDALLVSTRRLSRGTSIILIIAFFLFMIYNMFSHHTIFDEVLGYDEERDRDREEDLAKSRLTLIETVLAILFSMTIVAFMAYFLVDNIEPLVADYGLHDNFLGLILVPLAEKAAEHLSAIDEAYDNQINFALFHCLAPSIQTALFNAPLVVIVAWGLGKDDMNLNFEIFFVVLLVLSILVVGNFLRDGSSDYLEGALLLIVYAIVALAAWYYPNPEQTTTNVETAATTGEAGETHATTEAVAEHAIRLAKRMIEAGLLTN